MNDGFGRAIDYLRISITDRCNLRCIYCRPVQGFRLLRHEDILSFEEITEVARVAARLGFRKLRITGGEPLVRRNVVRLVELLAAIPGIQDLAMTTNGTLLPRHARALAAAGLQRVNVSLDAIRPERYAELTRGGDVREALAGIAAAREVGLTPVKLNCVVEESSAETDARDVAAFARREGCEARFIRRMNMETGHFAVVEGGNGGDCQRCNRLRLTSDGRIMPCLFSDVSFRVRELGAEEAILGAVRDKPEAGGPCTHGWMRGIGG